MNATPASPPRIGHGWDIHRLEPLAPAGKGRPLIIGGVTFDHDRGPVSHSDGDALLHALTDAMLGALGAGDIGQLFPDDDPRHDGADSSIFLADAVRRMQAAGLTIGNVDLTVICQQPKLGDHRSAIIERIAAMLGCEVELVNLKGKTHEGVDAVGEGRAIEAIAAVLLLPGRSTHL